MILVERHKSIFLVLWVQSSHIVSIFSGTSSSLAFIVSLSKCFCLISFSACSFKLPTFSSCWATRFWKVAQALTATACSTSSICSCRRITSSRNSSCATSSRSSSNTRSRSSSGTTSSRSSSNTSGRSSSNTSSRSSSNTSSRNSSSNRCRGSCSSSRRKTVRLKRSSKLCLLILELLTTYQLLLSYVGMKYMS